VSDYVRLDVLNQFGGIYLDTDVELLKGFDDLLDLKSFIGLESDFAFSTAVIGSEAHQTWAEMAIKDYQTRSFVNEAGRKDKTPNSLYLFELLGGKSSKYFDRVFPATFFHQSVSLRVRLTSLQKLWQCTIFQEPGKIEGVRLKT
ncbi:hypothetical protein KQ236_16380, partial [Lactococcus lactis]|nr:hypothetical protein [Lactococcus lactis]